VAQAIASAKPRRFPFKLVMMPPHVVAVVRRNARFLKKRSLVAGPRRKLCGLGRVAVGFSTASRTLGRARLHRLVIDSGYAPPTIGMMDDIVRLTHREKSYSRKQKNRYKRSLLQFNNLASELPDATVVLDTHNVIRWSNQAARTLLNVHSDRDRGQRIDNLIRDPDFHSFLQSDDPGHEIEMIAPSNSTLMIACRRIPSGRGMSVLVARDVTQRIRLREMRKDFVDDVSHELRTPLTVIRGYTEMLLDNGSLDTNAKQAIEKVDEQSSRMMHIVQKLLHLSRLEGNPLADHEGDTIAMADLVETLVSDLQDTASSRHQWVLDLDRKLAIRGNYDELYSVVQNLLQNAVKYSGDDSTITVQWVHDDVLDTTADVTAGDSVNASIVWTKRALEKAVARDWGLRSLNTLRNDTEGNY